MNASGSKITRKIAITGILSALAYVSVFVFHTLGLRLVPAVNFLTYDPKDIIICIAGLICGPLYGLGTSIVVSLIEMLTISDTGFYGFIMNVFSTCSFIIPASLFYKYKKSFSGALIGLLIGFISELIMMTLWNIIITPIYMGVERSVVVNNFLWPIVLFNMIKVGLNIAFTLILYKPIITAFRATRLIDKTNSKFDLKSTLIMCGIGLILVGTLILTIFLLKQ